MGDKINLSAEDLAELRELYPSLPKEGSATMERLGGAQNLNFCLEFTHNKKFFFQIIQPVDGIREVKPETLEVFAQWFIHLKKAKVSFTNPLLGKDEKHYHPTPKALYDKLQIEEGLSCGISEWMKASEVKINFEQTRKAAVKLANSHKAGKDFEHPEGFTCPLLPHNLLGLTKNSLGLGETSNFVIIESLKPPSPNQIGVKPENPVNQAIIDSIEKLKKRELSDSEREHVIEYSEKIAELTKCIFTALIKAEKGAIKYSQLPQTFIHGDPHAGNFMKLDNGDIALIDPDWAGKGPQVYDLAMMLAFWSINKDRVDENTFKTIYGTYNKKNTLTNNEKEALPELIEAATMRFWTRRFVDAMEGGEINRSLIEFAERLQVAQENSQLIHSMIGLKQEQQAMRSK